jgi:hypothetical protein
VLAAWLVGVLMGVAGEGMARAGQLWLYRRPLYPVVNVLMMFGVVMGGLSLLVPYAGAAIVFLLGVALGYAYEWWNLARLDWWYFPHDRFLVFRGKQGCALAVAALWGTVPVVNDLLRRAWG